MNDSLHTFSAMELRALAAILGERCEPVLLRLDEAFIPAWGYFEIHDTGLTRWGRFAPENIRLGLLKRIQVLEIMRPCENSQPAEPTFSQIELKALSHLLSQGPLPFVMTEQERLQLLEFHPGLACPHQDGRIPFETLREHFSWYVAGKHAVNYGFQPFL